MTPRIASRHAARLTSGAVAFLAAVSGAGVASLGVQSPAHAQTSGLARWSFDGVQMPLTAVRDCIEADRLEKDTRATGKGIGIALIDTGVAPVAGLTGGNVVNGPDLSFESQDAALRYRDTHGHGTHLAGIIAAKPTSSKDTFKGIAPNSKLTSIKVAGANGAVDVSQVIAGIDWVVAHRNDDAANPIKVLTLAYGTDGIQSYQVDPLAHAVENAWRAGIVVVVAGGNDGPNGKLVNPAYDPYVLAVGAMDSKGTGAYDDDTVADFSTRGSSARRIDLIAPGRSIVSLRAPGSTIDTAYPAARVDTRFFKGSGSSQAAAVTAGAIAMMMEARPNITPDRVKQVIKNTLWPMNANAPADAGLNLLDIGYASYRHGDPAFPAVPQNFPNSTGTGSLEAARGGNHVYDADIALTGENDIFGPLSTTTWATASATNTAWVGGLWMGRDYSGTGWVTAASGLQSWQGRAWSGRAWSGRAWSGRAWSSETWISQPWA